MHGFQLIGSAMTLSFIIMNAYLACLFIFLYYYLDYDTYTNLNPVYGGDSAVSGNDPDDFGRQ